MRIGSPTRISLRIALAALAVAVVAIAIVGLGVYIAGGQAFADLMAEHGEDTSSAKQMFNEAVTRILVLAIGAAVLTATLLAALIGSHLGRPLRAVGRAARSVAQGNLSTRVPRSGSEEIVSVADSFNQMAAALEEQERERRDFIANAAHELRTPLTNLQGYLEALRDEVISPDRQVFESLWEETNRLVRLSDALDQLAQGDASGVAPRQVDCDLPKLINAAIELSRPSLNGRRLTVTTRGMATLPVRVDPDRFAQVMANLLGNAARYADPGGAVVVAWESRPDDVLVSVANSGTQIPESDLPHVFERFYRVEKSRDRQRGGAGIGLAIVRQLVESAGGRVGAESRDGFTRFWFTVPRTASQAS